MIPVALQARVFPFFFQNIPGWTDKLTCVMRKWLCSTSGVKNLIIRPIVLVCKWAPEANPSVLKMILPVNHLMRATLGLSKITQVAAPLSQYSLVEFREGRPTRATLWEKALKKTVQIAQSILRMNFIALFLTDRPLLAHPIQWVSSLTVSLNGMYEALVSIYTQKIVEPVTGHVREMDLTKTVSAVLKLARSCVKLIFLIFNFCARLSSINIVFQTGIWLCLFIDHFIQRMVIS